MHLPRILLTSLLLCATLFATDAMRPRMTVENDEAGLRVTLRLDHVTEGEWRRLLADPDRFDRAGYGVFGSPEDPALPQVSELIPVDITGEIACTVSSIQYSSINGVDLKAVHPGHRESDPQVHYAAYDRASRAVDDPLPVELGECVKWAGQVYLPVTIRPLRLGESTGEIAIARRIDLQLHGVQLSTGADLTQTGAVRSLAQPDDALTDLGHYLVIVPSTWAGALENWVAWKKRKGHPVTVATLNITGTSANSIKSYIQTAYDTWEDPPSYVLLVGDEDQGIPGFYVYNPEGTPLVTDHPYALLDGDDSFPEVWVGRYSVDSASELLAVANKTILYESQPYMDDPEWFKRALNVCTIWAAASPQDTKNWVRRKMLDNGFVEVDTAYHPYQQASQFITGPINDGVSFVNYRGLGYYTGWSGPDFSNGNLYSLNNGAQLPVVTSVVCGGGNFAGYADPCFGELWLRLGTSAVPRGAVAFFGPSELYTHTQFNNVIDIGIYAGIFDLGIQNLGPALWHGKLELWRNYHQNEYFPFGQTPEFYHHVYNLLGDPGLLMWTDSPQVLSINHPATLNQGDQAVSVEVLDEDGDPVEKVFVSLYNSENAAGAWTDDMGQIVLPFTAGSESAIALTVTGRNLHPYLVTIPVSSESHPLSLNGFNTGDTSGLQAGQLHAIDLALETGFNPPTDVSLTLRSRNPDRVVVLDSTEILANLDPSQIVELQDIFELQVSELATHGSPAVLDLLVTTTDESWQWTLNLSIQAPELQVQGVSAVFGELLAGDSARVIFQLANCGGQASQGLQLQVLPQEFISIGTPSFQCAAIPADAQQWSGSCWITFSDQLFPGEVVDLQVVCNDGPRVDTLSLPVTLGEVNRYAPSLADDYGYRAFDDLDMSYSKVPTTIWEEIDPTLGGSGTVVSLYDFYEQDDATTRIILPFPLTFYGETYTQATVCSNGWIAPGNSPEVSFHNRRIPSPMGPSPMIAPYWDDLVTGSGRIVIWISPDNDRFILEWSEVSNLNHDNDLSFQVVFYNIEDYPTLSGDNDFAFRYHDYENPDSWANYSTVGIENADYTTGLQLSYNDIHDPSIEEFGSGRAIHFSTDRGIRMPAPQAALNATSFQFEQNPWAIGRDSLIITNSGQSPLVFSLMVVEPENLPPAPNLVAGFPAEKGGAEPSGDDLGLRDAGGDAFGYEWRDHREADGPDCDWIDIARPEYEVAYTGDPDDSSVGPFDLGFYMPFYDESYPSIYISTNGTISFESPAHPWFNLPLPNFEAPPALIAPWWDDLNSDIGASGVLYFYSNGLDTAIVTWNEFPKWGTSMYNTFQVVLTSNGNILFQYLEMFASSTSATVGMQNSDRSMGLNIVYNQVNYLEAGAAVLIERPNNWFNASSWAGIIPGESSQGIELAVSSQNLAPGSYSLPLRLVTNAENGPTFDIDVGMTIVLGELPLGDVNGDYRLNMYDILAVFDHIMGVEDLTDDAWDRADVNLDGVLNIIDAILIVDLALAAQ